MLKAGDVLDFNPIMDMRFTVAKTAADTGGESFEMEWRLGPHLGGTPEHIHPDAEEVYKVRQGTLSVDIGGKWREVLPGETVVIERGVPHTFKNATDQEVVLYNIHRPAQRFEEFFQDLHRLIHSGRVEKKVGPKTLIYLSMLWTDYGREIRSTKPPAFVMSTLAALGRALGMRRK